MRMKIAIGIVVLAAVAFICGASILAFATPATQDDPLITLSYLTDVFKTQVTNDIKSVEQDLTRKFNSQISELESQLQAGQGGSNTTSPGSASVFSVVTLKNGQSLTCSVGTEIMLRVGTANGSGTAPALINYTNCATLSSGAALATNSMYLVTIEGNGIKATAETVRVLVRGSYKIT